MRHWYRLLLAGLLALTLTLPAASQPQTSNFLILQGAASGANPELFAAGIDANVSINLTPKGTGTVNLANAQTVATQIFLPAITACRADNANLIVTRLATGDYALARTAAGAETFNIQCTLVLPTRTTASKGVRVDSFSISQQITVAALTSNTFQGLNTTTYANAVANAVAAYGGVITITPPTATQATPYLTAATVGTPAFMTTATSQIVIDFQVVMQNLGVYRLYGIQVGLTQAWY